MAGMGRAIETFHFRPRYAWANLGHPSRSYSCCYDTDSFRDWLLRTLTCYDTVSEGTLLGAGSSRPDSKIRPTQQWTTCRCVQDPLRSEPTIPPTTPPSVRSLACEGM